MRRAEMQPHEALPIGVPHAVLHVAASTHSPPTRYIHDEVSAECVCTGLVSRLSRTSAAIAQTSPLLLVSAGLPLDELLAGCRNLLTVSAKYMFVCEKAIIV
jgi:hypothetical protein